MKVFFGSYNEGKGTKEVVRNLRSSCGSDSEAESGKLRICSRVPFQLW
jgi:hypothetical protein